MCRGKVAKFKTGMLPHHSVREKLTFAVENHYWMIEILLLKDLTTRTILDTLSKSTGLVGLVYLRNEIHYRNENDCHIEGKQQCIVRNV